MMAKKSVGSFKIRDFGDVGSGDTQIENTAKSHMIRLIRRDASDPRTLALARSLKVNGNDVASVKAAYDWVCKNVSYISDEKLAREFGLDPDTEFVTAPIAIITGKRNKEDCDGMVCVLCCLLKAMGFKTWVRVVAWRRPEFTHTNAVCWVPSKNFGIALDPVMYSSGKNGFGNQQPANFREKLYAV